MAVHPWCIIHPVLPHTKGTLKALDLDLLTEPNDEYSELIVMFKKPDDLSFVTRHIILLEEEEGQTVVLNDEHGHQ